MFDELIDGLAMGAAAGAASTWARRKMQSDRQLIWSGEQPDGTVLTIEQADGRCRM